MRSHDSAKRSGLLLNTISRASIWRLRLPIAATLRVRRTNFTKPERLAKTAVRIPSYNEELTIADVVQKYRAQLPRRNPTATSNLYVQMRVTESLQSV